MVSLLSDQGGVKDGDAAGETPDGDGGTDDGGGGYDGAAPPVTVDGAEGGWVEGVEGVGGMYGVGGVDSL